jgi:RNA polymerase sigma-70 factor (ECF subfamily)
VDVDLVNRARRGDQRAFERLAIDGHAPLHRLACGILLDAWAAEEATQQALVDAWRSLRRLRDPARFEGWAYRWLIVACRLEARRQVDGPSRQVRWPQALPIPASVSAGVLERHRLERAFVRLSVEDRAVIVLRHLLDLSPRVASDALGIPTGALDARLQAAARTLSEGFESSKVADPVDPADGQAVQPWAIDVLPPDARMSAARAMASVERARQLGRWWPPLALVRPVRPVPALGALAGAAPADESDASAAVHRARRSRPTGRRLLVTLFASGLAIVTLAVGILVVPLVAAPPGGEQAARLEAQAAPSHDALPSEPAGPEGGQTPVPAATEVADMSTIADPADGRLSRRPR